MEKHIFEQKVRQGGYTYDSVTDTDYNTDQKKRKYLTSLLEFRQPLIVTEHINKKLLDRHTPDFTGKAESKAALDGTVLVRAIAPSAGGEDTRRLYKIAQGQQVALNYSDGKTITGIHPSWEPGEYKVVGTAMESLDSGERLIPVRLVLPGKIEDGVPGINKSGYTVKPYQVFKVRWNDTDGVWHGTRPDGNFEQRYLVNGSIAVDNNKPFRGKWLNEAGIVSVESSPTPAYGMEYGAKSGQFDLVAYRPGFFVMSSHFTQGSQYLVRAEQRLITEMIGKASTGILKGSSGSVVPWFGQPATRSASEYSIECYAEFSAISPVKKCIIKFQDGCWIAASAEC